MNSAKVLIFDDDADILQICTIVLKKKGLAVHTEMSSENLLEKVSRHSPSVILMDNKIPGMDGVTATRMIKENEASKDIPVIFFSANTDVAKMSEEASCDFYLQKPFDINELETIVMKALKLS
ncbi:response regulator [Foetidibacter luteolus]|uniref:response regulator n=1 Tax=Foetidibacter luteolus TaxID=2608880 RepID=UPI00129A3450|nr:response regulator [Foetidibacter luteolus]